MNLIKPACIAILLLYTQFSKAQVTNPDTSGKKVVSMNEIVISVNKTEESKKSVSQQIEVLTTEEIERLQSQTTADLLSASGKIFVQKSQMGGGSPVIRGFEANRIVLMIDGVRMNNIIFRGGHLQNVITTDNAIMDRAEILYGPSSTIYGSDALGGVIHFYTRKPIFNTGEKGTNLRVNAFSRYGNVNQEITGHADVNLGWKRIASLTSFTYSSFGDLKGGSNQNPFYKGSYGERPFYVERINGRDSLIENKNRYKQVQSEYTQFDLAQKLAFKQNEHTSHGLNLQFSSSSDIPRYDRLTDPSGGGLKYAEWYYGPQKRLMGAYDLDIRNPSCTFQNIHAGVNYQNFEESRHTRRFGNDNLQHRIEKVNVIGANADFQKIYKSHHIRFGLDLQYNTLKSTAEEENIQTGVTDRLDTRYPDGTNTLLNGAVYISHTWEINDHFTLTDGLRVGFNSLHSTIEDTSFFKLPYDDVKQNNPVYSGSLGLIHTPTDDVKLSILVSSGYRSPNVDDLSKIFESASGALIVPNTDLKPERTINTEAGVTKIFNGKTSWESTLFYTQFVDAIVTAPFTFNGSDSVVYDGALSQVLANQNKGKAYLYGFSTSVKSQCTQNLLLTFGLNYTYGRIKTDSSDAPLDHIPPFMMNLGLNYSYKRFGADFQVNYNGWKKIKDYYLNGEDNEQYAPAEGMPAWITLNLHASYQVHKRITLQAGVDNIFDTQYRTFASGINAPGRNIFAAIRFHY